MSGPVTQYLLGNPMLVLALTVAGIWLWRFRNEYQATARKDKEADRKDLYDTLTLWVNNGGGQTIKRLIDLALTEQQVRSSDNMRTLIREHEEVEKKNIEAVVHELKQDIEAVRRERVYPSGRGRQR